MCNSRISSALLLLCYTCCPYYCNTVCRPEPMSCGLPDGLLNSRLPALWSRILRWSISPIYVIPAILGSWKCQPRNNNYLCVLEGIDIFITCQRCVKQNRERPLTPRNVFVISTCYLDVLDLETFHHIKYTFNKNVDVVYCKEDESKKLECRLLPSLHIL